MNIIWNDKRSLGENGFFIMNIELTISVKNSIDSQIGFDVYLFVCLFSFYDDVVVDNDEISKFRENCAKRTSERVFVVNIESLCFSCIHDPNSCDKGKSFKLKLLNRVMNSEFRLNIYEQTTR